MAADSDVLGTGELWSAYRHSADAGAREALVRQYIQLVHHVAHEICRHAPAASPEELTGAGSLGLLRAIERFDPTRGLAFSTYAVRCIRGAILDDLRAQDCMSRGVRGRARRVEAARVKVAAREGREPRAAEVARELGIGMERYYAWRDAIGTRKPLYGAPQIRFEEAADPEMAEAKAEPTGPQRLLAEEERALVRAALAALPPRLQRVLGLLYFEEMSARDTAALLGVSESRISQLRKQGLERLRARLHHARRTEAW